MSLMMFLLQSKVDEVSVTMKNWWGICYNGKLLMKFLLQCKVDDEVSVKTKVTDKISVTMRSS